MIDQFEYSIFSYFQHDYELKQKPVLSLLLDDGADWSGRGEKLDLVRLGVYARMKLNTETGCPTHLSSPNSFLVGHRDLFFCAKNNLIGFRIDYFLLPWFVVEDFGSRCSNYWKECSREQ